MRAHIQEHNKFASPSFGPSWAYDGSTLGPIVGLGRPKLGPITGLWGAQAWAHMGPNLGPSWPYGALMDGNLWWI